MIQGHTVATAHVDTATLSTSTMTPNEKKIRKALAYFEKQAETARTKSRKKYIEQCVDHLLHNLNEEQLRKYLNGQ